MSAKQTLTGIFGRIESLQCPLKSDTVVPQNAQSSPSNPSSDRAACFSHSVPANRECYARAAEGRAFPPSLAAAVIIVNDDLNFSVPVRSHRSHTDRRTEHTIDAMERTPSIAPRLPKPTFDMPNAGSLNSESPRQDILSAARLFCSDSDASCSRALQSPAGNEISSF